MIPDSQYVIPCDTIALAIGQGDGYEPLQWLGQKRSNLCSIEGLIKTERGTGRTSVKGIYAGGDAAFGPALFITAHQAWARSCTRHRQRSARDEALSRICRRIH